LKIFSSYVSVIVLIKEIEWLYNQVEINFLLFLAFE
jgi:hypothetical protein